MKPYTSLADAKVPGESTIAWIIEPKSSIIKPYMTLKHDVAIKRFKAGDFVTPYKSQRNQEDEL